MRGVLSESSPPQGVCLLCVSSPLSSCRLHFGAKGKAVLMELVWDGGEVEGDDRMLDARSKEAWRTEGTVTAVLNTPFS